MRASLPPTSDAASRGRSSLALVLVLGTMTALGPFTIDMYLPSLPAIERELHASPSLVQMTLGTYFVGLSLGQLLYGPLSDRFGRRRPLQAGLALYVVASLGCAFAPSIEALIGLRFVQALGGAAGQVITRAVVRDLHVGAAAARMLAMLMLVMGVAPMIAPLVGGAILVVASFRAIFVVLTAIGLVCLGLALVALPETSRTQTPLRVRALAQGFAEVMRDRSFLAHALTQGFAWAGMFAYIAGSPFVLIELHGISPQHYGWIFGANAFALVAGSQVAHRLLARRSPSAIVGAATAALFAAGAVLLAIAWLGAFGVYGICAGLFLYLATIGFIGPTAAALAMDEQGARAGLASALLGALQLGLAALASAFVGALFDGTARPMVMVMAGCALLAFVCGRGARRPD